jgi:hypothetical protein
MITTPVEGLHQCLGKVRRADRFPGSSITKFLDFIWGKSELDWPAAHNLGFPVTRLCNPEPPSGVVFERYERGIKMGLPTPRRSRNRAMKRPVVLSRPNREN